ncbi:MAG: hypothetical protein RLZZ354_525 [Pseudomonadota bacterium]|jgi:hypothetical protein
MNNYNFTQSLDGLNNIEADNINVSNLNVDNLVANTAEIITLSDCNLVNCTAETPLNPTSVVNKSYVDDNFVDRTNNLTENINGLKTFTNNVEILNATNPSLILATSTSANARSIIRQTATNLSINNQTPASSIIFQINSSTCATINNSQLLLPSNIFLTTNDMKSRAPTTAHTLLSDITTGTLTISSSTASNTLNGATQINQQATFNNFTPISSVASPSAINHLTRKDYVDNNFVDRTNNLTQSINGLKTFTNNTNFTGTLLSKTNYKLTEYENTPASNTITLTFPMAQTIALRTTPATANPMTVTLPTLTNNERGMVFTFNKLFINNLNFPVTFNTSNNQRIYTLLDQNTGLMSNTSLLSLDKIQVKLAVGFFETTNYWIEQTDFSTFDRSTLQFYQWFNTAQSNAVTLTFPMPPTIAVRNSSGTSMTITLPSLTTSVRGQIFTFVKLSSNVNVQFITSGTDRIYPLNNFTGNPTTNSTIFPSNKSTCKLAVGFFETITYWIEVSDYSTFDIDQNNLLYPRLAIANTFTNDNIFNGQATFNNFTPICSVANPTANNHLVRKDYVDNNFVNLSTPQSIYGNKYFGSRVQLYGGIALDVGTGSSTFAGNVDFNAQVSFVNLPPYCYINPTDNNHLTRKAYVDNNFVDRTNTLTQSINGLKTFSNDLTCSASLISNNITAPTISGTNNIYSNTTTGIISIGSNLTTTGTIDLGNTTSSTRIFGALSFYNSMTPPFNFATIQQTSSNLNIENPTPSGSIYLKTRPSIGAVQYSVIITASSTTVANSLISNNITAPSSTVAGTNNIFTNLSSTGNAVINIGAYGIFGTNPSNKININCPLNIVESYYGTTFNKITTIKQVGDGCQFINNGSTNGFYLFIIEEAGTYYPLKLSKTKIEIAGDTTISGDLTIYDSTLSLTKSLIISVVGNDINFNPDQTLNSTYNFITNDSTPTPITALTISSASTTINTDVVIKSTLYIKDTTNQSKIDQAGADLQIENEVVSGAINFNTTDSLSSLATRASILEDQFYFQVPLTISIDASLYSSFTSDTIGYKRTSTGSSQTLTSTTGVNSGQLTSLDQGVWKIDYTATINITTTMTILTTLEVFLASSGNVDLDIQGLDVKNYYGVSVPSVQKIRISASGTLINSGAPATYNLRLIPVFTGGAGNFVGSISATRLS